MNYMKDVAKMLGVTLGERFEIEPNPCGEGHTFQFENDGLFVFNETDETGVTAAKSILVDLLTGNAEIVKLPWKPKEGDEYYYVCQDGTIDWFRFSNISTDIAMLYMGNYFRTEAEAKTHRGEIIAKFRKVMK